jgi:[ribosomal protein S5]-alanine N-acetyltransferase
VAWPGLVTERLELRPLPARTAAVLPQDKQEASRHLGARLHHEWPGLDLLGVLPRQAASSPESERFGIWVIIERDGRNVVGDVGFHGPPDEGGTVEIGYCVVPDRRRRGYATEATRALVEWATAQPPVRCIVAGCVLDNVASIRTLERVGFLRTGEANSEIRWWYGSRRDHV